MSIAKRGLHILQAPSTGTLIHLGGGHQVKNALDIRNPSSSGNVTFEVLGSPASLLKVGLPPSTPLYSRRNSLVATFGSIDSIITTLHIARGPFTRILAGLPFCYQKIISTSPISTLLSCTSSNNTSIAVLTLDGTTDWIVVNSSSLHAYSGELLQVIPRTGWSVLKRFSAKAKKSPQLGHTFLSGRGTVALASAGQLYQVTLVEGEKFLVQKPNLVAYSLDFNNSNSSIPTSYKIPYQLKDKDAISTFPSETDTKPPSILSRVSSFTRSFFSYITRAIRSDSSHYLQIEGPTTLLIQSATHHTFESFSVNKLIPSRKQQPDIETQVSLLAKETLLKNNEATNAAITSGMSGKPEEHFKIATVENGKVVFKSTTNFKEFTN